MSVQQVKKSRGPVKGTKKGEALNQIKKYGNQYVTLKNILIKLIQVENNIAEISDNYRESVLDNLTRINNYQIMSMDLFSLCFVLIKYFNNIYLNNIDNRNKIVINSSFIKEILDFKFEIINDTVNQKDNTRDQEIVLYYVINVFPLDKKNIDSYQKNIQNVKRQLVSYLIHLSNQFNVIYYDNQNDRIVLN